MTQVRLYRIALAASLALNLVLIAGIGLYIHFAGLLEVIGEAVGVFG